jgi:hypothetical protein
MLGPLTRKIEALRERISDLSAVHASLNHPGWANCQCPLAKVLGEHSAKVLKLLAAKKRRAA